MAADAAVLDEIHLAPEGFYVNLSTVDFPDGVVRGQLQPVG